MFESIINIFKKNRKKELIKSNSKDTAKERLHLVLMQDRANVSADFLDLMRKEIIEVIKKYIDIDEKAIDVRLTTETTEDGKQSAPALYANIPILNIKEESRMMGNVNAENKILEEPKESKQKEDDMEMQDTNQDEKDENDKNPVTTKEDDTNDLKETEDKQVSENPAPQEINDNQENMQESQNEEEKETQENNVETKEDEETKEKDEPINHELEKDSNENQTEINEEPDHKDNEKKDMNPIKESD